jgi:hypothetical protein
MNKTGLRKRSAVFLFALLLSCASQPAEAIRFESEGYTFGINGFLGFEYTYMGKMPMIMDRSPMPPMIMAMGDVSFFSLKHLNLLFSVEKDKFRALINLHTHHLFETEDDRDTFKGELEFQEAYGEYSFHEGLRIRAGRFLSPFGIYNDVVYILPIFSTVVLPQIYEPPRNYSEPMVAGKPVVPIGPLVPDDAAVMFWGTYLRNFAHLQYHLYLTSGETGPEGFDKDKDLGIGTRIFLSYRDFVKAGGSFYRVHNKGAKEGRKRLFGADITLYPFSGWTLQGEYVVDWFSDREWRQAYYVFLGYQYHSWNPYLRYDFLIDKDHLLLKREQVRYTAGLGYRFNPNILLKGEYHLHHFPDRSGLPDGTDLFSMIRSSIIFIF